MEMLDRSKDFWVEFLRIMSQFSQCGVDPRKHARSRPMRLNIRRPFGHGVLSRRLNEGSIVASERQTPTAFITSGSCGAENRFCQFGKISFLLSLAVWIDESKTISALQVLKRHFFDQRRFFRAGLARTKSSNPGSMK